jgi:hypothetical protein
VQRVLDRAAYFNLVTVDSARSSVPTFDDGGRLTGVRVRASAHRLDVTVRRPTAGAGLRATNVVGEPVLDFSLQWLLVPDDFVVAPERRPPPTPLDSSRSQRFGILDGDFRFAPRGESRFLSTGAGRTFPMPGAGEGAVRLAGIGNVVDATGELQGLQGVYVLSGLLQPPNHLRLNILIRFNDVQETLSTTAALPPIQPRGPAERGSTSTFMTFRTFADPAASRLLPMPSGMPPGISLQAAETTTIIHVDCAAGARGLETQATIGARVGTHSVITWMFPSPAQSGAPSSPIPFFDQEQFIFIDADGRTFGSVTANVIEGRSIASPIPGLPADLAPQVFGGFAVINAADGEFAGCEGLVTNVGIGTVSPHMTSILYLFDLFDPAARFRLD